MNGIFSPNIQMEDINYHTCLVIYIVGVLKFTPQSRRIVTVYSIAGSRGGSKGGNTPKMLTIRLDCGVNFNTPTIYITRHV
jgi:hypothetical protein